MKKEHKPTVSTKPVKSTVSALSIDKYAEASGDVWAIFKKYLPGDADLGTFTDDVHKLDEKYHNMNDLKAYRFMQKLLKVYFDELTEVKG